MIVAITLFLSIAAVLIFRPLTRKTGLVLETVARQNAAARRDDGQDRVVAALQQLNGRLDLLEDRLDFVEKLSEGRRRARLAAE